MNADPRALIYTLVSNISIAYTYFSQDLWKIRAPVGDSAQGFDLTLFDDAVLNAADAADPSVEPQPLWEYPNFPLSPQRTLITFDLKMFLLRDGEDVDEDDNKAMIRRGDVHFKPWTSSSSSSSTSSSSSSSTSSSSFSSSSSLNGIGFWMDWIYDEETRLSTGPEEEPVKGNAVVWSRHFKQVTNEW